MQLSHICLAICFLCTASVSSQTIESSKAIEKRKLQFELESLYLIEKEGADKINSWTIPSILIRYGLNNKTELQLNTPYLKESKYENDDKVSSRTFLDNVQAGVSINLWKEKGIMPEAALMIRALIPVYEYQPNKLGALFALNLSNTLSNQLSLNYNLGWVADAQGNSGYYITNLSWEISSVVHSFIEFFGSSYNNLNMNHNLNTGIGFNLGNSFCIDLSMANGLNHEMIFYGGILTYQISI